MIFHDLNWWVLFAAPLVYLLTNTTHELSHGLCVLPWKWTFNLKPYPTKFNESWYFALCLYHRKEDSRDIPDWGWSLNFISPRITNTLQMVAVLLLSHLLPQNPSAQMVYVMIAAAQLVDGFVGILPAIYNLQGRVRTDCHRFWKHSGWHENTVRTVNIVWFLVMVGLFFL